MSCDWLNDEITVIHIRKHILNEEHKCDFEEKKWQKELCDLKYEHLKYKTYDDITNHLLFERYISKSKEVVTLENSHYIFKSGKHYSCNFQRDDELTTCLRLKYKEGKPEPTIISCFFRKSTIIDANIIMYVTKHLKLNNIYSVTMDMPGLYLDRNNLTKVKDAIDLTAYENSNDELKIDVALRFISEYLSLQYSYYNPKNLKLKSEYDYFKYLITSNRNNVIISKEEKDRLIKNISELKKEIMDFYNILNSKITFFDSTLAFLQLCKASIDYIYNERKFKEEAEKILFRL